MLLRKVLRTIGLSPGVVDYLVDKVLDLLSAGSPRKLDRFPYLLRDDFLSPAEQNFYHVLKDAVQDQIMICPKVSLGDLFCAESSDYGEYLSYTNKIDRKHVDFLLCHQRTTRPVVGVELDDASHRRADRKKRDEYVENVFAAAGLPLLRVRVKYSYDVAELRQLLGQKIREGMKAKPLEQTADTEQETQAPTCPTYGNAMVLRVAKHGPNLGGKFWGCSSYPRCRGTLQVEPDKYE